MPSYKLSYFDFNGGRGESVRIAFHAAGIEFEDDRLSFPEFGAMRHGTRFNSLPVLEIDGVQLTQTNAMLRYVGKLGGLYPDDNIQAFYCDEVLGAVENLSYHIGRTIGLQGDELKEAREALVEGWLSIFLKGLDALLARGGGKYFADHRLTVADLKVFVQTGWLLSGSLDHIPKDFVQQVAPGLVKHRELIMADSKVVAYYASRA
jgi:glutathione S-transferase